MKTIQNTNLMLESLLQNVQSNITTLNNSLNTLSTLTGQKNSYDEILKEMKKKFAVVTDQDEVNEVDEAFKNYDEELKKFQQEMMIFDMFHDTYITNGFYGRTSKTNFRNSNYDSWGNIFSLQAERLGNQTKIAVQTMLKQQLQKLK
ncbi:MAG: hypothetical protein IJ728_07045 [Selenomonadaceae bacterium]|nr:hypothetical protein [Selenomonadaceae bacterium]